MEIIVHHSEVSEDGSQFRVATEVVDDAGSRLILHVMPVDTLEWRVAQFNIEPAAALDIVLAEPYMVDADAKELDLLPTRSQARVKVLKRKADAVAKITYQAGPLPEGMEATPTALLSSGDGDPKALLLEQAPVDNNEIVLKRAVMDVARELVREEAAQPKLPRRTQRRAMVVRDVSVSGLQTTPVVEQPSPLAQRLVAKRLDQIRTRRNVPDPA